MWRSQYEMIRDDVVVFTATEENPWVKVANSLFEGLPVIGALSGYVFHPRYVVKTQEGEPAVRA